LTRTKYKKLLSQKYILDECISATYIEIQIRHTYVKLSGGLAKASGLY